MILIYGKPDCVFCERAKLLCFTADLEYKYLELDKDFTREELLKRFPKAKTFPQIVQDGNHVGGYTEFAQMSLSHQNGIGV